MRGVVRAARQNLAAGHVVEGGSTITQQLVKTMLLSPEPSFARKVHELTLAYALTRRYSKPAILRMYLNSAYYGARAYGVEAAAKTGTSQDWKDNLKVGYTPQYTTAVWVGNANGEPMNNIIGIDGAGPIWHAVMTRLTLGHPAQPFLRPPGITLATVSGYWGLLVVPGSGWTITDVFAPNDRPHRYDNPYVGDTNVPLWDPYSMDVHDGNWDYLGTRRYALPVGGPLQAHSLSPAGAAPSDVGPGPSSTTGSGGEYTVTQIGPGVHPPLPGNYTYTYTYTTGPNGELIYTYHYYYH